MVDLPGQPIGGLVFGKKQLEFISLQSQINGYCKTFVWSEILTKITISIAFLQRICFEQEHEEWYSSYN